MVLFPKRESHNENFPNLRQMHATPRGRPRQHSDAFLPSAPGKFLHSCTSAWSFDSQSCPVITSSVIQHRGPVAGIWPKPPDHLTFSREVAIRACAPRLSEAAPCSAEGSWTLGGTVESGRGRLRRDIVVQGRWLPFPSPCLWVTSAARIPLGDGLRCRNHC